MISIFNLTLAADEAREVAIAGEYFELRNAVYPVALIELLDRSGGVVSRLENPEQSDFVRPGRYETVRITNGPTAQTIKHFYGSGDAGSRRTSGSVQVLGTVGVTGVVEVVDGGKARTKAASAFTWAPTCTAGAAQFPECQLWNPAASGKNLIVTGGYATAQLASGLYLGIYNVQLGTAGNFSPANKKSLSVAASVALSRKSVPAANPALDSTIGVMILPAAGQWNANLREPIVIEPNSGLMLMSDTVNHTIAGMFEFFEEAV